MAKTHKISVQLRKDEGKGASRRLRHAGHIPAIVYGGNMDPVSIQIVHNDVFLASQHEWFYSAILDLDLDGDLQKVLLRDMQRHPFKAQINHLDFLRVRDDQEIRIRVPLHFLNQETSVAGKTSGVIIMHELTEIEVSCLPKDLPEFIEVDLGELAIGDIVHLSEIKLPEGVEIPALKFGKEQDIAVVIARLAREEVDPEPAEGEAVAAAPTEAKKDDKKDAKK
ncbi:MAG: 50S ribosomal protein L25/general stress protein Ctc [Dokdonella sp.]